jgi:hypothetical protein
MNKKMVSLALMLIFLVGFNIISHASATPLSYLDSYEIVDDDAEYVGGSKDDSYLNEGDYWTFGSERDWFLDEFKLNLFFETAYDLDYIWFWVYIPDYEEWWLQVWVIYANDSYGDVCLVGLDGFDYLQEGVDWDTDAQIKGIYCFFWTRLVKFTVQFDCVVGVRP